MIDSLRLRSIEHFTVHVDRAPIDLADGVPDHSAFPHGEFGSPVVQLQPHVVAVVDERELAPR